MAIPSFDNGWRDKNRTGPRIIVLEVRDRNNLDGAPVAHLLVERTETYTRDSRDDSIYEASICLTYERITSNPAQVPRIQGSFLGGYSKGGLDGPAVSLTSQTMSKGAVFLDPPELRGLRIGTYLMNEIVAWCQTWPAARVNSVELLSLQASDENRARRHRFYVQFGLDIDYRDPDQREGRSKSMLVSELRTVESWKENLRVLNVSQFITDVLHGQTMLKHDIRDRDRALKHLAERIGVAEARPVRWAMQRLGWRLRPLFQLAAFVLLIGAAVWARGKL